jgi:hypothetical protein
MPSITPVITEVTPSGAAADALIRGLLEACGIAVGVAETDATPPLSDQECAEVFAWYEAAEERFTDYNAALREHNVNLLQVGIALPGNLGSVDLDAAKQ